MAGQLRLTGWAKRRWDPEQALVRGLAAMGLAFLPLALTPPGARAGVVVALVAAVTLLAVGGAVVYPFEMDTVVSLSGNRLVATHYGLYNTVSGLVCASSVAALARSGRLAPRVEPELVSA